MMFAIAVLAVATPVPPPPRLSWDPRWQRVSNAEYGVTLGLLATAGAALVLNPEPPLGFRASVLFDEPLRDALLLPTRQGRDHASVASDVLQYTLGLAPFADVAGLALTSSADSDLLWQLTAMNLESTALTLAFVTLSKRLAGRTRPQAGPCESGTTSCIGSVNRQSFMSGHTATGFAGAALLCVHHEYLPIYGHRGLDRAVCPVALGLATANGLLRVAADRHWATDVVAGAAVGLISGYALPQLLHYAPVIDSASPDLQGQLQLSFMSGALGSTGPGGVALGGHLGLDAFLPLGAGLSIEGRFDGVLLRTTSDERFQQARTALRGWYGPFGAGLVLDVRSVHEEGSNARAVTAGPTIAFGVHRHPDFAVLLSARWLALIDGQKDLFGARLEVALIRWVTASVEVQSFVSRRVQGGAGPGGEIFLVGLGGRVPW